MSNIKKDNKGKYYFVISAGYNEKGKRRQIKRSGFETKKEAQTQYDKIKAEIVNESYIDGSTVTFGDLGKRWLFNKKYSVQRTTFERYERLYRLHIEPAFAHVRLQSINSIMVQDFIIYLSENKGFSYKTCLTALVIIKDVFVTAKDLKLTNDTPYERIKIPRKATRQINVWTKVNIDRFIELRSHHMRGRYYVAILTGLLTGLRKSEILGLKWSSVDFDNNIIYVDQILTSDGKELKSGAKTKTSVRRVTMPKLLAEELQKHRAKQSTECVTECDLVFRTKGGIRVVPTSLNKALNQFVDRFNFPPITVHDLRHTHATLLIEQNVNVKLIQERLGHVDVQTTLNIYSHVLPTMQREVTDRLDALFVTECDRSVTSVS